MKNKIYFYFFLDRGIELLCIKQDVCFNRLLSLNKNYVRNISLKINFKATYIRKTICFNFNFFFIACCVIKKSLFLIKVLNFN